MRHNRVTIGDIIATRQRAGRIEKIEYFGPYKTLHVVPTGGKGFLATEKDIMRISKKR
jgi:hypothetical protein